MKYSISLGSKDLLNSYLLCVFISLQVRQNTNESVLSFHDTIKNAYFFQNPFNFPILFFISSMEGEDDMALLLAFTNAVVM